MHYYPDWKTYFQSEISITEICFQRSLCRVDNLGLTSASSLSWTHETLPPPVAENIN